MIDLKVIGLKIQMARKIKNMNQEQFATATGLSIGTIQSIEQGRSNMTFKVFNQICKALDINGKDLI